MLFEIRSSTPQGGYDIFVRKHDASGKLLWGRQFGTRDGDLPTGLANDSGDNVYIAGVTYGDLAGSKGGDDSFVRKYSPSGKPLWTVQFGTRNGDYTSGIAVHGSSAYVVGAIQNYNTGDSTGFVRKFASDGRTLWQKPIRGYSFVNDIATDNRGNIYIVGAILTNKNAPLFLRKYTSGGSVLWTEPIQGDPYKTNDLAVDGSSVYIAGGEYNRTTGSNDVRIIKFSRAGVKGRTETFDLGGSVYVFDISACGGEIAVAGQPVSNHPPDYVDGFTLKLTPGGSKLWMKRQATAESDATGAVLVSSAGVYAAGVTDGKLGKNVYGSEDAFLTRLRSRDGATVWVK